MASIFRIPRSPFYFAAFRDAMGRRCQRTTKTGERPKALRIAMEFERASAAGREGLLTEAACRKVLSQLHEQTTGKPLAFYSVESWINEWLANCAGTAAPRTLERYAGTCRDFLAAIGERSKVALAALTVEDLRQYRDALKMQGRSPATCNQTLKILRAPLEEARRLGHVPVNPAHGVKALKDASAGKREAFTADQVAMLLDAAKGTDWQGCILFGALCGLRLKDAANVTWACLDMDASLLKMTTAKRGVGVTVPLHPALVKWLASRPRGVGKAPCCHRSRARAGAARAAFQWRSKKSWSAPGSSARSRGRGMERGARQARFPFTPRGTFS